MSKITQLNVKAIAATIPPEGNINNAYLWGSYNQWWVRYTDMPKPGKFRTNEIRLPEGTWVIEGVGDKLTEDQWKGIVELHEVAGESGYGDYEYPDSRFPITATESGLSLLKSKGMNPESILILIKQNSS